ncbi:MAG TPA: YicC family protein [Leucothrix mucor]|uniref:YicC family protein n=1 Tax=Leucothrix mucor TaxID=45248 RepID=A0A7V2T204_LEUMU|nr:YicC family protein [Leucothrix mucor]
MTIKKSSLQSMTAYARGQFTDESSSLEWELRSVNHRYLDVSLYLPSSLFSDQNELKEQIRNTLKRGKIEAQLSYESTVTNARKIIINKEQVKALLDAQQQIETLTQKANSLSIIDILNWQGVIETPTTDLSNISKQAHKLLEKTLEDLIATRLREGQQLSQFITIRCDKIASIVDSVRSRRKEVLLVLRKKVLKRIADLDLSIDENRLEQELVIQAQRLDVSEEIDRLTAHIQEVKRVLQRKDAVGRRLDFLMQELNREVNTLGSKSNDAKTTQAVVDLKVLVEQMREQVQNIE